MHVLLISPFAFYVIPNNGNKVIDKCSEFKDLQIIYRFISIVFRAKNKGK